MPKIIEHCETAVAQAPSAGDLRAALARAAVPAYIIAARAQIHPTTLSLLLRERRPLSPDVARRILAAIDSEAQGR